MAIENNSQLITVFLADDSEDDRNLFQALLKRTPLPSSLTAFPSGDSLLNHLKKIDLKDYPDFIFLDTHMPGRNGKECLKEIRRNQLLDHTPVIMCSFSLYKEDIDETLQSGANLFVPKSKLINAETLKQIFSSALRNKIFKKDRSDFVLYLS